MKPTKSKSKKFWSALEAFFTVPAVQFVLVILLCLMLGSVEKI